MPLKANVKLSSVCNAQGKTKSTADELVKRITDLIPTHPEILSLDDAWGLFKVEGFDCKDLGPTLFQAQWALAKAKKDWRRVHNNRIC